MKKINVDRRSTSYFSDLANAINDQQERLSKYLQNPIDIAHFGAQLKLKKDSFPTENRLVLNKVLTEQLTPYFHFEKVKENVKLLKNENTFTVTAGHQLNLYGGPLYLIYKIIDTIRLAEKLKAQYKDNHFVPVFWMATEDHDFEEINHLHLFRDTLTWNSAQKGPVGRFSLEDMGEFKKELTDKFQNNTEFAAYLENQYKADNLAQATTEFLMELVGDYGVVIIDADNTKLKTLFSPLVKKEIETHFAETAIAKTTEELEKDGYFGQAHARPINLFYIKDQLRERIIPLANGKLEIGEQEWEQAALITELENHPERFSPNVVLRPLYQETTLPNLCYLGGGGEMAYWLQLKGMFEAADVPYPLIKVRNSVQLMDKTSAKRIEKLELEYTDIFTSIHEVKKQFVLENSEEEMDFSPLDDAAKQLTQQLEEMVSNVDKGLVGYAKSEATKIQKQIEGVKSKIVRHQKRKYEASMSQIDGIYDKMFPNNGLQERYDNMIPYLAKYGKEEFIKVMYELIDDPFETALILGIED